MKGIAIAKKIHSEDDDTVKVPNESVEKNCIPKRVYDDD